MCVLGSRGFRNVILDYIVHAPHLGLINSDLALLRLLLCDFDFVRVCFLVERLGFLLELFGRLVRWRLGAAPIYLFYTFYYPCFCLANSITSSSLIKMPRF